MLFGTALISHEPVVYGCCCWLARGLDASSVHEHQQPISISLLLCCCCCYPSCCPHRRLQVSLQMCGAACLMSCMIGPTVSDSVGIMIVPIPD